MIYDDIVDYVVAEGLDLRQPHLPAAVKTAVRDLLCLDKEAFELALYEIAPSRVRQTLGDCLEPDPDVHFDVKRCAPATLEQLLSVNFINIINDKWVVDCGIAEEIAKNPACIRILRWHAYNLDSGPRIIELCNLKWVEAYNIMDPLFRDEHLNQRPAKIKIYNQKFKKRMTRDNYANT